MIVADTDLLIDVLRGQQPAASRMSAAIAEGRLATTTVTSFELLGGAATTKESRLVGDLLDALVILPFDEAACRAAAACRRELEPRGRTVGTADYLIAGICISRSLPLVTRNRKHFERMPLLLLGDV